jgi:hypothetical protein
VKLVARGEFEIVEARRGIEQQQLVPCALENLMGESPRLLTIVHRFSSLILEAPDHQARLQRAGHV